MKETKAKVLQNAPSFGWMNSILFIDLTSMEVKIQDSRAYVPDFLGARGIAGKIAWDNYPEPVDPFDPANPLMVFPGALTGTRSPYSGRTSVLAFSPQAYPYTWFTRSNIGGRIGGNLKRAGYDGLVITGKAEKPARVRIVDDEIAVLSAEDLWGVDALDTLDDLNSREGEEFHHLVIGQAGERLSRIATIQTGSSSACGQGGFGAVMGSKNLKAVSVLGTGTVRLAHPEGIRDMARRIAKTAQPPRFFGSDLKALNEQLAAEGNGRARFRACTESCVTPCQVEFSDVPGTVHKRTWRGDWHCVAAVAQTGYADSENGYAKHIYDWHLDRRAAFEMNALTNRYGINQFDLLIGIVPWLITCQKSGSLTDLNGIPIDFSSPQFWDSFLHAIAYRDGLGDVLAEGGMRAPRALGIEVEFSENRYTGWGHSAHWDGHSGMGPCYPYWISSALQWLVDTRDPFSTGHGSLSCWSFTNLAAETETENQRSRVLEAAREFGERVYGHKAAADPFAGYEGKAQVGHFHSLRPVIKDCVPVDDLTFPLLMNKESDDYRHVLRDIEGVGDVDGEDAEYFLFRLGTGTDWSKEEFGQAAERVLNIERALQVRHWGRDRAVDESVLQYFDQIESDKNPLLKEKQRLDREQFSIVLDEFYELLGWNPMTGIPTPENLGRLGIGEVYKPMMEGKKNADDRKRESTRGT